jgi:hypothetical protein
MLRAVGIIDPCLPSPAKAPPGADVVGVERDAGMRSAQQNKSGLTNLDRQLAQVLAVEFEQVEGAQHGVGVVAPRPDHLEHRESGLVADDRLAVDQAGAHRQCRDRCHDQGKAFGERV